MYSRTKINNSSARYRSEISAENHDDDTNVQRKINVGAEATSV